MSVNRVTSTTDLYKSYLCTYHSRGFRVTELSLINKDVLCFSFSLGGQSVNLPGNLPGAAAPVPEDPQKHVRP